MPLWIESHINLGQHPKTRRLARALGVSIPAALGHLHLLWHWAIQYAQDGDLGAWDVEEVAVAAMWEGCAVEFFNALRSARFVDDGNQLHDWHDYAGRLIEKRHKDADRLRRWRQMRAETRSDTPPSDDETRFVRVSYDVTVPNLTVPNQGTGADAPPAPKKPRKPKEPRPTQATVDAFCLARNVDLTKLPDKVTKDLAERAGEIVGQYTSEDVTGCTAYLLTDRWYYDKALPALFTMVIKALPTWVADGRPAKQHGRNGHREEPRVNGWDDNDAADMLAEWDRKKAGR